MNTVLIISPHFPPVNAPDMQRVRVSLNHYTNFGWLPIVVGVDPSYVNVVKDPLLEKSIPSNIGVYRTRALKEKYTRLFGIGNLAIRAFPFLYRKAVQIINNNKIDLIFFSTTMFISMPLGRILKSKFGIPYVLDMQDPWVSNYKLSNNNSFKLKQSIARRLHKILESWTMKEVDGLISVSNDYTNDLLDRYPYLENKPVKTLTFGACFDDFNIVSSNPQKNPFFKKGENINAVYVGRGGDDMRYAVSILFDAFKNGLKVNPELFSNVRFYFIGTDYAPKGHQKKTIEPVAEEFGISNYVYEYTSRVPYFQALQLLIDSDFLIVPGSDDPQYTASKIYPYILANKPLLCIFNENSSVVDIVKRTRSGEVVSFNSNENINYHSKNLFDIFNSLLSKIPFKPDTDWESFQKYSAENMTKKMCELFDDTICKSYL